MTDTTPTAEQEAPLTSMKVADLQALAAGLQIRGARSLRKGALIEAIEAARASAEPEAPSAEPAAPAEQAEPEAQDAPAEAPATPEASETDTQAAAEDLPVVVEDKRDDAAEPAAPVVPELSLDDLVLPPARGEASEQDEARDDDQGRAGQRKRGRGRGRRGRGAENEQNTEAAEPTAKQDEAPAEPNGDVQDDEQQGGAQGHGHESSAVSRVLRLGATSCTGGARVVA